MNVPVGHFEAGQFVPAEGFLAAAVAAIGAPDGPAGAQGWVVGCQKGKRGGIATAKLAAAGFTNVANLQGGLDAWVAAELPVAK